MRIAMAAAAITALAGCNAPSPKSSEAPPHGRYAGIGTYSPGALWARMAAAGSSRAPQAATTSDDEHIIVVVDSQSGEVRECGDYSGVCVSFNPWTRAIAKEQASPVTLTKHLSEVAPEKTPQPAQSEPAR